MRERRLQHKGEIHTGNTRARVRVRMRTRAVHFTRCALLRVSPFLSASRVHVGAFSSSPSPRIRIHLYTHACILSLSLSLSLSPPSLVFPLPLTCSLVLARSLACARVEAVPPVRRAPRCCRLVVPLLFDEYLVSELQLSVAQRFSTASYVPDDSPTRTLCKTTA
jgi:hypothetical protein